MNFITALAYYFCLALSAEFTQPGDHLLGEPCTGRFICLDVQVAFTEIFGMVMQKVQGGVAHLLAE